MLRALRNANWFLQSQREISAGLVEKLLKLERSPSGSMLCTASSLTPISRYPRRWSKNGFPWERLEQKKKHRQAATGSRLDVCRKTPTLIIKRKACP